MGQTKKTGLELGGREINAVLATEMEKHFECIQIGHLSAGQILDWFRGKIEAKHRTDAMEDKIGFLEDLAHTLFKVRAELFQATIAVRCFKLSQLGQAGGQCERISREGSGLIHWSVGRQSIHHVGSSAECADRQPAPDHFSHCGQIRPDTAKLLIAAAGKPKSSHYLVENQERAEL